MQNQQTMTDLRKLLLYKDVKDNLLIQLISYPINKEYLKTIPHTLIGDIAVTYHIVIQLGEQLDMATISNEMFEIYNIPLNKLHTDAIISTQKIQPIKIMKLLEAVDNLPIGFNDEVTCPIFIITNEHGYNGSAAILYEGLLDYFTQQFNDDLTLLPVSRSEWLLAPYTFAKRQKLHRFLRNVTSKQNIYDEFLSSTIYHYDRIQRILETEEDFIRRNIKEKIIS